MAKNKKKNSGKSNELDFILEQLKQSYGSESLNNNSEQSIDDDMSEKDPELNAILSKIFSDENPESQEPEAQDTQQDDININRNDIIADEEVDLTNEVVESNDRNATFEALSYGSLELDLDEKDGRQVDVENDITKSDVFFDEIKDESISLLADSADVNDAFASLHQDDISTNNIEITSPLDKDEIIINSKDEESISNDFILKEICFSDDADYSLCTQETDNESIEINSDIVYNEFDSEIDYKDIENTLLSVSRDKDESFAVEDEEYSVQYVQPKIILSSDKYTFDPLQEKLPDLRFGTLTDFSDIETHSNEVPADKHANNEFELNKNDISLLLKFGYDDEVKSQIGNENTQKALHDNDISFVPETNKIPFGFCGKEYCGKAQNNQIKSKFRSQKKSLILSLVAISVLSLFILITNIFFAFFSDRSSYLIVLGFEFLLIMIISLIAYKKIYIGLLGIVRFDINKYSILCYIIFTYIIYDILSVIIYLTCKTQIDTSNMSMFGFVVSLYAVISLASDLLKCIQEFSTFELLISSDKIYSLELQKNHSNIYNSGILRNNEPINNSQNSNFNQDTYKICETTHISGYFKKTSQQRNDNIKYIIILGITPALSLLAGSICSFTSGSLMLGASTMMLTTLLCTPLICIGLPYAFEYIVASLLRKTDSAFIGIEAPETLSKAAAIIFKDSDAIEVTSFTGIHPNNSADSKKSMNIAAEVFTALSGSLSASFASPEKNTSTDHNVIINSISDNGIDLYFDSSANVLIGDKAYLRSHNIKVKTDSNLSTATRGAEKSVIYMAINGSPKLGFIISSRIKEPFSRIVSHLNSEGTKIFVESYEPQINDLFFEQNKSSAPVTVYKPDVYESPCKVIADGCAISTKSSVCVAELIPISKKIVSLRKKLRKIIMSTMIIGLLISSLFIFWGSISVSNPVIDAIKYHQSLLMNMIFVLELIPGIVFLFKIKNNSKKDKNNKKHKN